MSKRTEQEMLDLIYDGVVNLFVEMVKRDFPELDEVDSWEMALEEALECDRKEMYEMIKIANVDYTAQEYFRKTPSAYKKLEDMLMTGYEN